MCGIVGILDWSCEQPPDEGILRRMLGAIQHRGPDEFGIYVDHQAGIGCARLSIVDLCTGQQPIPNEDNSLWIVFNGEVFNYPELRAELEQAGHHFSTRSDTEVILHLYEDLGPRCLEQLNGQFAIAIWDARRRELFLARDRLGIRPLYYTELAKGLVFGSEIKTLFEDPRLEAQLDHQSLAQCFTFWAPLPPRSIFRGVVQLPPGCYLLARSGLCTVSRYWSLDFPQEGETSLTSAEETAEQLRDLLSDATRLRLRADVKVGSYLSGGLDSTLIAALVREHTPEALCTFSIAFQEAAFDERPYQEEATRFLNTEHQLTTCVNADIGAVFPEVVWHTEAPLLRTSPAPMYLLSRLVHENRIKVVLTGEGADEFLGGYNIYREDKVRRFWARQPDSTSRPLLLRKLYPYVTDLSRGGDAYLAAFFRKGLEETGEPGYSHQVRWRNTTRLQRLFSAELRDALRGYDPVAEFLAEVRGDLTQWSSLAQAQYIEIATFMSSYLLSSQGDRMMAANSVEGRFPFLDHRVVEFCNGIPPHLKIRGLREKHILRKSAEGLVPSSVWRRSKQPYRAPIHPVFFGQHLDYVEALLSPEKVRSDGFFNPQAVNRLAQKCQVGERVSEGDDMALVGILSTQLLQRLFVEGKSQHPSQEAAPVRVCRGSDLGSQPA